MYSTCGTYLDPKSWSIINVENMQRVEMSAQLVTDIEITVALSNIEATLGAETANLLRNKFASLIAQVAGLSEDLERTKAALAIADYNCVTNAAWA